MSDRPITRQEYRDEIKSIVDSIKEELTEYGGDVYDRIHEDVDSHQWVIYYAYNLEVLQQSDNAEYGIDNGLVDAEHALKEGGLSTLHSQLAYWAMVADVQEEMGSWEPGDDRECGHKSNDDCMNCTECGECKEDLDCQDKCQACGGHDCDIEHPQTEEPDASSS